MAKVINIDKFFVLILFLLSTKHFLVWGNTMTLGANLICDNIPGLVDKQRGICHSRPDIMVVIGEGAEMARMECQTQFSNQRWNCTSAHESSLQLGSNLPFGSKEAGFAFAMKSAGIAFAITQGCARGSLKGCGCDLSKSDGVFSKKGWKWGGCSADIVYGSEVTKLFLDAAEADKAPRSLMNLHNNRVGRKTVRSLLEKECKCHGPSGSCAVKTCWMSLPRFNTIGDRLTKRYKKATKVVPAQLQKSTEDRTRREVIPSKSDMVFLEDSPNYCDYDESVGSLGTAGRLCNTTSNRSDGCHKLCCGRGFNTRQVTKTWQCECKFHWCCHVTCQQCTEEIEEYTCK